MTSFKWSPDGARLAYLMKDPDSKEEEKMKKNDVILVDKNYKYDHIYTVSIAVGKVSKKSTKQLTSGAYHVNGFDWSPDGSTLAFSFAPNPKINDAGLESDISTIPSDSGKVTSLVKRPGVDVSPFYSPDGKWIAFQSSGGQPERHEHGPGLLSFACGIGFVGIYRDLCAGYPATQKKRNRKPPHCKN